MKIIISNVIEIEYPSKDIMDFCKKKLTYVNPEYQKRRKMGFWTGKTPKEIKLYCYYNDGIIPKLYVPYGFFEDLWDYHPIVNDYVDYTSVNNIDIKSNIKLREYQLPCIKAIKEHNLGIFNVIVGLGKTQMALECVSELKQKTLWITHTGALLNQSKDRADNNLICKTSVITEGKCDLSGDIVFATMQTLIKYIDSGKINQNLFGFVIADEVHKCSCNPSAMQMFRTCVEYFSARYRLGLTGSLWRSDGLEKCIEDIMGHPIYSIYQKKNDYVCEYDGEIILSFPSDLFSVKPKIIVKKTPYSIKGKAVFDKDGGTVVYTKLINDLAVDTVRNSMILNDLKNMQGSTIVLSDRIVQLEFLKKMLGDSAVLITGSTPNKDRSIYLDEVRTGKKKYILSSYSLAKEGLDVVNLSNLVMATPVKADSSVIQSIGRIMRICDGKKEAFVYDYVDEVGLCYNYFEKRRNIYVKNNWDIENVYMKGGVK